MSSFDFLNGCIRGVLDSNIKVQYEIERLKDRTIYVFNISNSAVSFLNHPNNYVVTIYESPRAFNNLSCVYTFKHIEQSDLMKYLDKINTFNIHDLEGNMLVYVSPGSKPSIKYKRYTMLPKINDDSIADVVGWAIMNTITTVSEIYKDVL